MQISFHFNHNKEIVNAVAIYDFRQVEDAVVIKPTEYAFELGDSIVFRFDKNWNSESSIKSNYPDTYSNIVKNLVEKFRTDQVMMESYTQNFLS